VQGIEKRQWLHLAARDTPEGLCCAASAPEEIAQRGFGTPILGNFQNLTP